MLRHLLAEYAHNAWAGWMRYLFSQGEYNTDGSFTIPQIYVERWSRQMNTAYENLPKTEQSSDLDEADKIIDIIIGKYSK
jgi:hypothetical protein